MNLFLINIDNIEEFNLFKKYLKIRGYINLNYEFDKKYYNIFKINTSDRKIVRVTLMSLFGEYYIKSGYEYCKNFNEFLRKNNELCIH